MLRESNHSNAGYECTDALVLQSHFVQLAAKYDISRLHRHIGFGERFDGEYTTILISDVRDIKMNPLNFTPVNGIVYH